jgi:hypothetical protein
MNKQIYYYHLKFQPQAWKDVKKRYDLFSCFFLFWRRIQQRKLTLAAVGMVRQM